MNSYYLPYHRPILNQLVCSTGHFIDRSDYINWKKKLENVKHKKQVCKNQQEIIVVFSWTTERVQCPNQSGKSDPDMVNIDQ